MVIGQAGGQSMGERMAPVVVVEYMDYRCAFCSRHAQSTLPKLLAQYVEAGKVRYVVRDFPLGANPASVLAAQGRRLRWSPRQGFWQMHDILFSKQRVNDEAGIMSFASELGIDLGTFTRCLANSETASAVSASLEGAERSKGLRGTPTFFIAATAEAGCPTARNQEDFRRPATLRIPVRD